MSDSDALHELRFDVTDPEALITVFDGHDLQILQAKGTESLRVKPGLYTVRIESAGQVKQAIVKAPQKRPLEMPRVFSPVPLESAADHHEYYSDNSRRLSVNNTASYAAWGGGGRILLFLRLSSMNAPRTGDIAEGLSLLDPAGATMIQLTDANVVQRDDAFGWVAFSTDLLPGYYRLRYDGAEVREAGLYVFGGWTTQVFVMYHEKPRLEQMRVLLSWSGAGFDPSDPGIALADRAILGLQNGLRMVGALLPEQERQYLLQGKFRNPMLGLIGAHWLLASESVASNYARLVLDNLRNLIGPCPDLTALEVEAGRRYAGWPAPASVVWTPPMIRRGLEILARDAPHLLVPGSLAEQALPALYADSPWTCWRGGQSAYLMPAALHSEPWSEKLNWMEEAVLAGAIRGEPIEESSMEALARRYALTPQLMKGAFKGLVDKIGRQRVEIALNSGLLSAASAQAVDVQFRSWYAHGAAVFGEPPPRGGFAFETVNFSAAADVVFAGRGGDVCFRGHTGETGIACIEWDQLFAQMDPSGILNMVLGAAQDANNLYYVVRWNYESGVASRGAVALAREGPAAALYRPEFIAAAGLLRWLPEREGLETAFRALRLPCQTASDLDLPPGAVLVSNVEGSVQVSFDARARVGVGEIPSSFEPEWRDAMAETSLNGTGSLEISGAFRVIVNRPQNAAGRRLKFSIVQTVASRYPPLVMARVDISPSGWLAWFDRFAASARDQDPRLAQVLDHAQDALRRTVSDRAYFSSLEELAPAEEHWYRAEQIQGGPFFRALGDALATQAAALGQAAVQDSNPPAALLEIEVDCGAPGEDWKQIWSDAIGGRIDLRDTRDGVRYTGALEKLSGVGDLECWVADPAATASLYHNGRIVLYDEARHTGIQAAASLVARTAAGSGPAAIASPSTTVVLPLWHANMRLVELTAGPLLSRWMPDSSQSQWKAAAADFFRQNESDAANVVFRLKLDWILDLRDTSSPPFDPDELFRSGIRRELRLLLPLFHFDSLEQYADLDRAAAFLVYSCMPEDLNEIAELDMNTTVLRQLGNVLMPVIHALRESRLNNAEPEQGWWVGGLINAAVSGGLQDLIAFEDAVCASLTRGFAESKASHGSAHDLGLALDGTAVQLAKLLENSPYLQAWPERVAAARDILFTAAISLSRGLKPQVASNLSLTAIRPGAAFPPTAYATSEYVPIRDVAAYMRIAAVADETYPGRLRAMAGAGW